MTVLNACTIVSKNYLPFARVLANSFRQWQPEGRFFLLLLDRAEGKIEAENEAFEMIEVEDLSNLPDPQAFLFKYTILEANTAAKPFFMEFLLQRHELENLVYFDPDIWITGSLDELAGLMAEHSVVLTPHLTDPVEDDAHPGELAILQSGAYNLGFIALRGDAEARRLLSWWQERLYDQCVVRIYQGLFVDQKWIDLVPGLFSGVYVHQHPGYNVAYWNLHGRTITLEEDGPRANGEPLVFFHFSGIQPDSLQQVSKHQDRFTLADLGGATGLYHQYRDLLLAAGFSTLRHWSYAFARFDHGAAIPDPARRLFLSLGKEQGSFGNPFHGAGEGSFFHWLNTAAKDGGVGKGPYLSRLLAYLHASRPDLQRSFPDPAGKSFAEFSSWLLDFGRHEMRLDPAFLQSLHVESRATLFTVEGLRRRLKNRLKRAYHSTAGQSLRQRAQRTLGAQRWRGLKRRLRPSAMAVESPPPARRWRLAAPLGIAHPGVNLIGYLQAETGMGEAARGLARSFQEAGIPLSLHSLELGVLARQEDPTFEKVRSEFPYSINLLVVNADQVLPTYEHLGGDVFGGRYNIGLWFWEQERFPRRWWPAFDVLHEVWSASSFAVDALSAVSPVPVRRVPLPVAPQAPAESARGRWGIAEDCYLFFFMFNYLSHFERKNPLALVRAFRLAFGSGRTGSGKSAHLLIKTSHADYAPEEHALLQQACAGENIQLLDAYLDREEISALNEMSDCYVSLHRSEGFGLTLAEAMGLGKPVIATPYSGVTDFFDLNTGYPVRYDLIRLAEDVGPYPAGSHWAEPDEEDAAHRMRHVFEHQEEARMRGKAGQKKIMESFSHAAVGSLLRRRFDELVERVNRSLLP